MKKLLFIVLMVVFVTASHAENITLEWQPPISREDGAQFNHPAETSHFDIYNADDGTDVILNIDKALTEITHDFPNGQHSIVITLTDTDGRESTYSPILSFTAGTAPKAPQVFRIKQRAP